MSSWGSDAASRARRERSSRLRKNLPIRRAACVPLITLSLMLCAASAASASNFYWYGEGNSTCWQTGAPADPSSACDDVGAGYLNSPGHLIEGAVTGNLEGQSTSGDYCNAYNIGDGLTSTDEISEGAWTGFTPPTPYGNWQEGDAHKTVCQADGATWGQEVRGAANSECTGTHEPCGMQHYVSFASQGLNDRPWASAFSGPILIISAEADPQTATTRGGAWGYICPMLRQGTTNHVLEYCLEQWRTGTGYTNFDVVGECTGTKNYAIDETVSEFAPGTAFATEVAGSANTFVFESKPSPRTFIAGITETNLLNAIKADNTTCGTGLSTNPSEYALVGVEQGMEGRGLSEIGVHVANLQLRTEYAHYQIPPVASTGEPTGVTQTEATVHGSVDPEGSATEAYFEYGKTNSYGSRVPYPTGWQIGEGTSSIPAYETLTGLEPGTTYHYRVVGHNAYGTSHGADATFTTPGSTAPAVVRESGEGRQWVYYPTAQNNIEGLYWSSASWSAFDQWPSAPAVAQGTSASAVLESGEGQQWVYYQTAQGNIEGLYWDASAGKWEAFDDWPSAPAAAPGTSPSAMLESSEGQMWVYYQTARGTIDALYWDASAGKWSVFEPVPSAPAAAPGTSPSAVLDQKTGKQWIYYHTAQGNIEGMYWNNAGSWSAFDMWPSAPAAAAGTSPTVNIESGVGQQWVYYQAAQGNIEGLYWDASAGKWEAFDQWPSAPAAAQGTSPSAVYESGVGQQWVYYHTAQGTIDALYWDASAGKWFVFEPVPGALAAAPWTSPTVVRESGGGQMWVYYQAAQGNIEGLYWDASAGKWEAFDQWPSAPPA
jgi:uncharacterized cupin superfamily protein